MQAVKRVSAAGFLAMDGGHDVVEVLAVHIALALLGIRGDAVAHQLMGQGAGHPGNGESQADVLNGAGVARFQNVGHKAALRAGVDIPGQQAGPHVGHKTGVVALPEGRVNKGHRVWGVGE
jgi:hypothetical protein